METSGADVGYAVRAGGPARRGKRRASVLAAVGLLVAAVTGVGASPVGAVPPQTATWAGHGVSVDGEGGVSLGTEVCGTENGAPVDGTYLQWVLVAKSVSSATLTIGSEDPVTMARNGTSGTFQYVQTDFEDLADVLAAGASASYVGKADPKAKVVLGSGCLAVTLTVVSAVPFAMISLGLTEAECLSTTTTGTGQLAFDTDEDTPSECVLIESSPPETTYTVVMPINPTIAFTPGGVPVPLNSAVLAIGGTFSPNPACSIYGVFSYCLVTTSTTVTIQATPV